MSERYYRVNYVFDYHDREKILKNPDLNRDAGEYTKHIFDDVKGKDEMTQMQYFDINTWLPYDILHKADRMSMCNSLEVRTPLVDKEVAKSLYLPLKIRIRGTETMLFRTALSEPERIARRKEGFPSHLLADHEDGT